MVYCGKPSKGCQSCREKKTRCDKATPSCTQCIRARRTCPGYRNQLDLMFRIENSAVIEKSKSREASKLKASTKRTDPASSSAVVVSKQHPFDFAIQDGVIKHSREHIERQGGFVNALLPSYQMSPTLEQRARCFFTKHSMLIDPGWDFDLVDKLCNPRGKSLTDSHLLASINAVGLAGFANSAHAPELMIRARQDYVVALRLTNAALRSPTEVKKDATLFSVMILSIFETIAGTNVDSLVAWTEHVNGAAALVKLRGRDQFKTAVGQRLFQQVTSNLMVICIQRTLPMPAHIIELREAMGDIIGRSNLAWKLSAVIVDFTVFRAGVFGLQVVEPRKIVEAALELDQRFLAIFQHIPENWKYETVYTDENPETVWNGHYHVYQDSFSSQIWNGFRTCRILLHEIIRDQILISNAATTPIFTEAEAFAQDEDSTRISLEMQADILASVPQERPVQSHGGPSFHSLTYFIIWPLYLVGVMNLTTNPIRQWVAQRLKAIGEEVGIKQASIMSGFVSSKESLNPWESGSVLETYKPSEVPGMDVDGVEATEI